MNICATILIVILLQRWMMNYLTKISVLHYASHKGLQTLFFLVLSLSLFGCVSLPAKDTSDIETDEFKSVTDKANPKSIFVFMDGTGNNSKLPTNIFRTFKELKENNDKQTIAYYIVGVGNADSPIGGTALGFGMEDRILLGYAFIARQYQPGDSIYLFGFSRGAHTARSLAGLISYAGVPKISGDERNNINNIISIGNDILELTKDIRDSDFVEDWKKWQPGNKPLLAEKIRDKKINGKKGREVQPAEVKFLGVWDTVPGSAFKDDNYFKDTDLSCKESIGFVKESFVRIPGIVEGERYKTDSYPVIRHIAHAVSNDEKRSMFRPLFLCSSIINPGIYNSAYTKLFETVFPGAHADVGGGYEDLNNELPNISLNWMINLLSKHYNFPSEPRKFTEKPDGLAHLSISDPKASKFSECRDRKLPEFITKDISVDKRENAGLVPLAVNVDGVYQQKKVEQKNINCNYITQQKWNSAK